MTRTGFLLALVTFVAATATATAAPPVRVPPQDPPHDAPGRVRAAPAPLLGMGLPAIIAVGAAVAGYGLWRRQRRPDDEGA